MIFLSKRISLKHCLHCVIEKRQYAISFLCLFINFGLEAQTTVGGITTGSSSCSITLNVCEGDTLTIVPQNRTNYTNYKWYLNTVSPANEITVATATASNVVSSNFSSNFPTIKVISNGGIYIVTSEYSTAVGCKTINDTVRLNFSKRPIVQAIVDKSIVCVGGSVTFNATLLAGSGSCTFQWQHTTDGIIWSNIQGATNNTFTTPPLSNSVRYRAQAICSGNACCN